MATVPNVIWDTGPLFAVLNADDKYHEVSTLLVDTYGGSLVVPALIVTEVCYSAATRVGSFAEAAFLRSLSGGS